VVVDLDAVALDVLVTPNNAVMHLDILKCIYTKQPVSQGISPRKFLASRAFENAERLLDDVGCKTSTLLRGMYSGQITIYIVGGFNPFEKHISQIGSFPQLGVNIKTI